MPAVPKTQPLPDAQVLARPVAPDAAIAFWQQRAKLTDAEAKALGTGAKHRAFYVTGLAQKDLVQSVSDGIQAALQSEETHADFKKRIADVIKSEGWHSHQIENIFRTNMQTAYAAGRYAKMQAVKASRPYWRYFTIEDKRRRPSHAVLHGMVYPADHEFWERNYTPNGFRCRCGVQSLSARQVQKMGLEVQHSMPTDMLYTDPVTGMEIPVARPGADDGFRNNVGKDWLAGLLDTCAQRLEESPQTLASAFIKNMVAGGFEAWTQNPQTAFPLAVLLKADAARMGSASRVARLSPESYAKQLKHHPELTLADYALAQDAVEYGEQYPQSERKTAFVLNQAGGMVVIVKATRIGDELYVTSLYRLSEHEAKRDKALRNLGKK